MAKYRYTHYATGCKRAKPYSVKPCLYHMSRYACGTNMIYYAFIPLFYGSNVCHKWILKAMLNRKKLNVRIAPDLYRHLKENAPTTMTDYVETLLMNGLMSDISDIYKDAQDRYDCATAAGVCDVRMVSLCTNRCIARGWFPGRVQLPPVAFRMPAE